MVEKKGDFQNKVERFKEDMHAVIGDVIRRSKPARLGAIDSNGNQVVKVPDSAADDPNEYFITDYSTENSRSKALLQPGALPETSLVFGTPIRVKRDELTGKLHIISADLTFYNRFFQNTTISDIVDYSRLQPALIQPDPNSPLRVFLYGGEFRYNNTYRHIRPRRSINWGNTPASNNIPATANTQTFVLICYDFIQDEFTYRYGDTVLEGTTYIDALTSTASGASNAILFPNENEFRYGYVILQNGISKIDAGNIINAQEFLDKEEDDTPEALPIIINKDNRIRENSRVVTYGDHTVENGTLFYVAGDLFVMPDEGATAGSSSDSTTITFEEEDGSPSVQPEKVIFKNGIITDNSDGSITIQTFDVNTILTDDNGDVLSDDNGDVLVYG